ncbi:hypothetical protein E2C01_074154 [Portunus trituberculatus]|uniref:Uncharacterized protein n=1 Tax=Portunus trituberculatus TaxID=210409 RepID=A0A5B7IFM1_PORTR|nr:hypothetical protein [Portunus trituberculatus]
MGPKKGNAKDNSDRKKRMMSLEIKQEITENMSVVCVWYTKKPGGSICAFVSSNTSFCGTRAARATDVRCLTTRRTRAIMLRAWQRSSSAVKTLVLPAMVKGGGEEKYKGKGHVKLQTAGILNFSFIISFLTLMYLSIYSITFT